VIYIDKQRDKFIKRSLATLYINEEDMSWLFNRRLKPPEPVMEYIFNVTLPEQAYKEYNEYRMKYVGIALKKTQKELEALAEEAADELEEIASSAEKKDLEEIKNEEIEEEVEDLEEFREKYGY
jgi:ATP-dependent Lon protease